MRTATTPARRHPSLKKGGELKVTLTAKGEHLKIYMNGLVHVCVPLDRFRGFNSWYKREDWYCIEFELDGAAMLLEYNSFEKWSQVLKLLDGYFD